jgi:hypothetical protein
MKLPEMTFGRLGALWLAVWIGLSFTIGETGCVGNDRYGAPSVDAGMSFIAICIVCGVGWLWEKLENLNKS